MSNYIKYVFLEGAAEWWLCDLKRKEQRAVAGKVVFLLKKKMWKKIQLPAKELDMIRRKDIKVIPKELKAEDLLLRGDWKVGKESAARLL